MYFCKFIANHEMSTKNFLFFFAFAFCLNGKIFSQPFPEQDCIAAIPVCQDIFVQTTPYTGSGTIPNEINGNNSCLVTGEVNDVWYTFTVQTSGNLCFLIIPDTATKDYDWAVFNLTNSVCSDIYNDPSLEVACNFSNIPGATGTSNDSTGGKFDSCIAVNVGETYVLNVSKFSTTAVGYTLDFSASTAQLYDNIPPELDSVYVPITCGDTQIVITFTENVLCATVQPSDFTLTGPSVPTISNVASAGCSSGSSYDNQYILTVSPAIAPNGIFSLTLLASAAVEDLCNNPNVNSNTFDFTVSTYAIQVSTTPQLCSSNNGTATANPSGGVPPYSYLWNTSPTQNTVTATGLIPGVYTVTVTDAVGCNSTGSGNVGFDPGANPPVASISSFTNATCAGMNDGSASVSATGGTLPYAYIWSDGQTNPTATGLGTGTIICTVTDNNGCYDTASVLITGGIPIVIRATPDDTVICKGGAATLSASVTGGTNPFTYTWLKNGFFDGTNIPYPVSPAVTTVYSVFATDNAGCRSDTDDVTVTVLPPIDVNILPVSIVCAGDSVNLKANASGGRGSSFSYIWSNSTDTGSAIYVKPVANTTYTVTVSDGCTATPGIASIDVIVGEPPPTMKIFADPPEGCVPLKVQFHIEPFIQGYIYKWDFGDGNLSNTTFDTVYNTYMTEGCKNVALTIITTVCRDSLIDSCMIDPFPTPNADFTFSPVYPTTLSPVVTFYDKSIGADTWQWDLGDYAISNNQVVQHEYADSGSYVVRLVAANEYFCTDTAQQTVIVNFESTFYLPNSFSPNEDELNDVFGPFTEGVTNDGFIMYIFDRWGSIIYQTDNINNPWDGKIKGNYAEDGVYMYFIKFKTLKGEEKKLRGSVTLLK